MKDKSELVSNLHEDLVGVIVRGGIEMFLKRSNQIETGYTLLALRPLRAAASAATLASMALLAPSVQAQETTADAALTVPVFESVDENGVDLTTGMLRLRSPTLNIGGQAEFGLEWTGQSWRYIGVPTISRDGSTIYVSDGASTEEFKDRTGNYDQKKPINGSSLICTIFEPSKIVNNCEYTNRWGDIFGFEGRPNPNFPVPGSYGQITMAMGNLGTTKVWRHSGSKLYAIFTHYDERFNQRDQYISVNQQEMKLTTANHDGTGSEKNWLRPKSTTQTITDASGSVWSYTINSDREIATVQPPGGLSSTNYNYNSSHRVTSATSPAGTWTYNYTTPGDYRLVTVQTPTGRKYSVKSHREHGYVVEYRENSGLTTERLTKYDYDSGHRLFQITYPELNYVVYDHDIRGNVTKKSVYSKPTEPEATLVTTAEYSPTCSNRVLCNRPLYIVDPEGNRTDFEYAPPETRQVYLPNVGNVIRDYGHGQAIKIIKAAAAPSEPKLIVENAYVGTLLTESRSCISNEICDGTSDEVITTQEVRSIPFYADAVKRNNFNTGSFPLHQAQVVLPRSRSVTHNGQTLRTCFEYDEDGRLVSQTPPRAGITSCPTELSAPPAYNATTPSPPSLRSVPSFSQ